MIRADIGCRVISLGARRIFAIARINSSTADKGLQLMGLDIDESGGSRVVNHNGPLALSETFTLDGLSG